MNDWSDAKSGRMALYVIGGLFVALMVMLALVVVYGGL